MITFSIGYDIRTYIERKKILQFDALKWEMFKLWALFCILYVFGYYYYYRLPWKKMRCQRIVYYTHTHPHTSHSIIEWFSMEKRRKISKRLFLSLSSSFSLCTRKEDGNRTKNQRLHYSFRSFLLFYIDFLLFLISANDNGDSNTGRIFSLQSFLHSRSYKIQNDLK